MVNNLFSIFDPSSYYSNISWTLIIAPVVIINLMVNNNSSNNILIISSIINNIKIEIYQINSTSSNNITSETLSLLFIVVATLNVLAIIPFNFTIMAHMSTCLPIAITIWISTIVNALSNSIGNTMAHLTPIGTPTPLINFMVIIELISSLIRPITLSVRLIANIVAGHLLMLLLSNFSLSGVNITSWAIAPIITLISLEITVAIIQAYVITTLICLYYKETF